MSQINSSILNKFSAVSAAWQRAKVTEAPFWPSDGEHRVLLMNFEVTESTVKINQVDSPALRFEISYQLTESGPDATSATPPTFSTRFDIPQDPNAFVPEAGKQTTRFGITLDRLKTTMCRIAGLDATAAAATSLGDLAAILTSLAQGRATLLSVRTEKKSRAVGDKTYTDYNCYINSILASAPAGS